MHSLLTPPLLETENLSIRYAGSERDALANFNLQIFRGEIVAAAGESGSGKTTLLQALAALLQPTSGQVRYNGKPLPGPWERLVPGHPEIALAFQENRLVPMLTLRQNLHAAMRGFTPQYIAAQTDILLNLCRVPHLAAEKPTQISGGERQRAALAMALASHPQVLLLDEPFSNLDAPLKNAILTDLTRLLKTRGTAAVLVTHDPADALSTGERIYLVRSGQLLQTGSPEHLYNFPATEYAAGFFGENNIFNTRQATELLLSGLSQTSAPDIITSLPINDHTCFFIRPKHIVVSPAFGNMECILGQRRFFGSHFRTELTTPTGIKLIAHSPEKPPGEEGQVVWVRFERGLKKIG